jgi:hypothetical protein
MKMYKEDQVAEVLVEQVEAMTAAGWEKTAPKPVEKHHDTDKAEKVFAKKELGK